MIEDSLVELGRKIADLRIHKNLTQSELAYEAGISNRTLQRLEAGEVVKTDSLLKALGYLEKLDDMMSAIDIPKISPYKLAINKSSLSPTRKKRVKHSSKKHKVRSIGKGKIVWPEDQK